MKIGADNSLYTLIAQTRRNTSSVADEKVGVRQPSASQAPAVRSDQDLISEFHTRMSKQALDWADTDKDGKVTKAEFMDGQARLAELNGEPHDTAYSESKWAKLDARGKGWISEEELHNGLEKIFPVQVGHLDSGYAERLRTRRS
ncbi:EF-hand domain-containing protein [Neorhizobium sp. T25_27]|uniref:EF-hand domain-containing protein n=1 Tax=Neorhizobium sp. T25_27 TaxID=2093831 RepID=UPI000CF97D50|nr:EF-hand domain-containing protein [Neorhizobium sp. T25_27]